MFSFMIKEQIAIEWKHRIKSHRNYNSCHFFIDLHGFYREFLAFLSATVFLSVLSLPSFYGGGVFCYLDFELVITNLMQSLKENGAKIV